MIISKINVKSLKEDVYTNIQNSNHQVVFQSPTSSISISRVWSQLLKSASFRNDRSIQKIGPRKFIKNHRDTVDTVLSSQGNPPSITRVCFMYQDTWWDHCHLSRRPPGGIAELMKGYILGKWESFTLYTSITWCRSLINSTKFTRSLNNAPEKKGFRSRCFVERFRRYKVFRGLP